MNLIMLANKDISHPKNRNAKSWKHFLPSQPLKKGYELEVDEFRVG